MIVFRIKPFLSLNVFPLNTHVSFMPNLRMYAELTTIPSQSLNGKSGISSLDIKIGSEGLQATNTQIEECFFLVKKTAIKIDKSYYTKVEGCMAINDSGDNSALFIDMTEKAIKLIYSHNYVQNLRINFFFGSDGMNVKLTDYFINSGSRYLNRLFSSGAK